MHEEIGEAHKRLLTCCLIAALACLGQFAPSGQRGVSAAPERCFPATGYCVVEPFVMVQPFAGGVMIETIGNQTIPYSNPVTIPSSHWRYEVRRCPSHQPGATSRRPPRRHGDAGVSWMPSRQGSSPGEKQSAPGKRGHVRESAA